MTSWKSPDDPSVGVYSDIHDTNGYPQNLRFQGEVLIGRLGPWHGLGFSGFPLDKTNQIYSLDFVMNENEIYHIYKLTSSIVQRIILTWDGRTLTLQWIERIQDWIVYAESEVDNCDRFSLCGAYGICNINKHPPCSCMQGFEPRHPEEWEGSDWASGCKRREPLTCGDGKGDGFLKIPGVKPAKGTAFVQVMQILDIRNGGSGCLLWLDELLDTRVYDGDQDLYIRLAASELEGVVNSRSNFNKEKRTHIVVLITSSVVPLLFAVAYAFRKIKKRPHMKSQGKWYVYDEKNTSLQIEQLDDLQFFSLYEVARATDNFSVSNKIGQGGFGPVYKMKPEAEA
uniref:Putative EGF-like domain-containing protein n=1 Tax=Helianthus annuus TaxID=4232 RepID=A0A251T2P4_HELAN